LFGLEHLAMVFSLASFSCLLKLRIDLKKAIEPKTSGVVLQATHCDPYVKTHKALKVFFFSSGNYHLLLRKLLSGGC